MARLGRTTKAALWLFAVGLAALALAACGSDDDGDGGGGGGSGGGGDAAAGLELQTEGQLTVGAEFPVKGFVELPIDDPKGFEVDLAAAIAKELGVPKVQWKNTPFSGLFSPAPKDFDMAINEVTITPERSKVVDFSAPYFDANQGFLIKKGGPGEGVTDDRRHEGPAVRLPGHHHGRRLHHRTRSSPSKQPREYSTLGAATQALANGQIDAFVMDVAIGAEIVKERGDDVDMTGQFETNEQYGAVFEKGNPLRGQVNEAIEKIKADGTLEQLQAKWFPGTEDLPDLQVAPDRMGMGFETRVEPEGPGSASGALGGSRGLGRRRSQRRDAVISTVSTIVFFALVVGPDRALAGRQQGRRVVLLAHRLQGQLRHGLERLLAQRQADAGRGGDRARPRPGHRRDPQPAGAGDGAAADRRADLHRRLPRHPADPGDLHRRARACRRCSSTSSPSSRCSPTG